MKCFASQFGKPGPQSLKRLPPLVGRDIGFPSLARHHLCFTDQETILFKAMKQWVKRARAYLITMTSEFLRHPCAKNAF